MKKIWLLVFLLLPGVNYSQGTGNENPNIIYFNWPNYRMNGIKLKSSELKNEIFRVPPAIPYYKKAKLNQYLSYSLITTSVVCAILANKSAFTNSNKNTIVALRIVAGTASIAGVITFLFYRKNMKRAVALRNKALL